TGASGRISEQAAHATPRAPRFTLAVQKTIFAYVLVLPVVALIVGLVAYPFFFAIYVSFTNRLIGTPGDWIGFGNYLYLLISRSFQASLWNLVVIAAVSDFLKLLIGRGLALLVNQRLPGRGLIRSILLLPWAMRAFVAFLTWRVLYQPIGGGISLVLAQLG